MTPSLLSVSSYSNTSIRPVAATLRQHGLLGSCQSWSSFCKCTFLIDFLVNISSTACQRSAEPLRTVQDVSGTQGGTSHSPFTPKDHAIVAQLQAKLQHLQVNLVPDPYLSRPHSLTAMVTTWRHYCDDDER